MKTTFRRVVSFVMAMAMVMSFGGLNAFAITESDGESVTISATNVTATKSDAVQTVNVLLYMDKDAEVSNIDAQINITDDNNMGVTFAGGATYSASSMTGTTNLTEGNTSGGISVGDVNAQHHMTFDDSLNGYVLVTIPFSIPANAVGTATVSFSGLNIADFDNASGYTLTSNSTTATISVSEAISTDPYTANISTTATNNTVVNGQDIEVKVNVGGNTGKFSSAQIVLDYDPAYLTYKSAATSSTDAQAPDYEVDSTNGTLTIRDYGEAITAADGVYTVTFTAAKGGETAVELTSAGFSDKERAEQYDLLVATGVNELDVTINHKVTVNDVDAGSVAPDGSFEYTIPNYDGTNNTYDITVTMGGVEQDDPTIDANGKFTISSVTGDLVITYTATAKNYTVTWSDDDNAVNDDQQVATVTHGTDITFDVPANLDPVGTTPGYKYVVTVTETDDDTKTIAATSTDNGNGLTYTIDGNLIEADITITITKETVAANQVTVTITGADVTASVNGEELTSPATVAKDSDVVLTLTPEVGYNYEVKLGETDITSEILDDNQYTIENITESVTVTVTRTLDTSSVEVQQYVQLDGTVMWLVTINGNGTNQIDGKTYSYDGGKMYWSSKYQAYCYLVVAENLDEDAAKAAIGETLVAQAATAVNYEMDVNISGTKDVNDAQLVWNMYSAEYNGITTNVNMEKFLRADVNGSKAVDTSDAAAIITAIKTT